MKFTQWLAILAVFGIGLSFCGLLIQWSREDRQAESNKKALIRVDRIEKKLQETSWEQGEKK